MSSERDTRFTAKRGLFNNRVCLQVGSIAEFDSDTEFEESAREGLRIGRDVDIIGLVTGDTRVQASRITMYEGHAPVRMPTGGRIILPNGTVVDRK